MKLCIFVHLQQIPKTPNDAHNGLFGTENICEFLAWRGLNSELWMQNCYLGVGGLEVVNNSWAKVDIEVQSSFKVSAGDNEKTRCEIGILYPGNAHFRVKVPVLGELNGRLFDFKHYPHSTFER